MSNTLQQIQDLLTYAEVSYEHNVFMIKKLKELEQSVINGKRKHLGLFNTELEASEAYQNKL